MLDKQKLKEIIFKLDSHIKEKLKKHKIWTVAGITILVLFLWLVGIYSILFSAPLKFPIGTIVQINKHTNISQISTALYRQKIIRSDLIFKILAYYSDSGNIVAGDYRLKEKANVFTLVRRFTRGEFDIKPIKITILEGLNSREIATLLDKKLPFFDKEVFLKLASSKEGELFPDTYFIKPTDDEKDITNMMVNNFEKQVEKIKLELATSSKTFSEILTMASIIEVETRTKESRRMVSGILWNRIEKGMKLQVDAVFPYIMDKYSLQLTIKDLQIDSPYNTYKYKGLPPSPIGNPGLDSILAAVQPTKTSYLYYLSDRAGQMYYAETYKSHMINRQKYIGN